jgi:hypothetical protein
LEELTGKRADLPFAVSMLLNVIKLNIIKLVTA